MLRKVIVSFGLALMFYGVWVLARVHSTVGSCSVQSGSSTSVTGLDASCARTLLAYGEGFVFVASGLLLAVIAFRTIARRARLDLRGELRSVPRTWKTPMLAISNAVKGVDGAAPRPRVLSKSGRAV